MTVPEPEEPELPIIFRWETLRVIGAHVLRYEKPIHGVKMEVELSTGSRVRVFRADDSEFYFCHGLTFGGKGAPGGAVSPFSDESVKTILRDFYAPISESFAGSGDILVWHDIDGDPIHSAILVNPVHMPGTTHLHYASTLRSKNGLCPEQDLTLERLIESPEGYGESYTVFWR